MYPDALDQLWNSAANRPDPEAGQRLALQLTARLRRRRTFQVVWLIWTFTALGAITALAIAAIAHGDGRNFRGSWALLPLLTVPWFTALYFLRAMLRAWAIPNRLMLAVRDALHAAEESNRSERRRIVIIAGLLAGTAPLSALAIRQLHLMGKATLPQTWSILMLFGVALAVGLTAVTLRHRSLTRERRRIEARLREFEAS